MKLKDVLEIAYLRCDEDPTDREEEIDILMKYGINQAYKLIRKTIDRRLVETELPLAAKTKLPADFLNLLEIKIDNITISEVDVNIFGYDMYISPVLISMVNTPIPEEPETEPEEINDKTMLVKYIKMPADLVADEDEVDLKFEYMDSLSSYAAYLYLLSQSKVDLAKIYLTEFNQILAKGDLD